jgi:CheY-like chemotaxis protein
METTGGILTVRLSEEIVDEGDSRLKAGPYAVISVSDTGCGIEQENIDRIFDPYFTTKEVGKGSGMGLSVVHGIVKSNEGVIRVESAPGDGSTFTVFLPSAGSQNPQEKRSSRPTVPGGHEHILVVDDEPTISDMTRKRLEKLGYQVSVSNGSMEALALFRKEKDRFDLVITDQTMPQLTGESMAGEFLAIRPDIPIILTSGYSAVVDEEKAIQSGIKAFLMKPVSQNELAVTIRKILDKRTGPETNGTTVTGG